MARQSWYERLSPVDATFLYLEDAAVHMHVGGVFVYEGRPPRYRELAAHVAGRLERIPRYRQRLAFVPLDLGRPVWVDDAKLDITYHVRHSALPPPGGDAALKRLASRVFGLPLDHAKPMWELELVEGLGRDRFAVLSKTHHCLTDGIGGNDIISAITDGDASVPPAVVARWTPRPAPKTAALVAAALRDQLQRSVALLAGALRPSTEGRRMARDVVEGARPLLRIALRGRAPASTLNEAIGPHRRWEMTSLELAAIRQVRTAFGGTVNDVLLAVVAGALRKMLEQRGETLRRDLRVFVPVNVRPPGEHSPAGNQVAAVFCPLPVGEPDPAERLAKVAEAMNALKRGKEAIGTWSVMHLAEFAMPPVAAAISRLEMAMRRFNLVVSNIPGPRAPRYLLGRKLLAFHPIIPLSQLQTLAIGLYGYAGSIDVGLLGDADRLRDLPVLARAIPEALAELVTASRARVAAAGITALPAAFPLPQPSIAVPAEATPAPAAR